MLLRSLSAAVLILVALAFALRGHTENLVTTGGQTNPVIWQPGSTITYRINNQTSGSLPNMSAGSNPSQAVTNAFATIGANTGLTFVNGGTTAVTNVGSDGINLVTFANTPANISAVGGAVAVTILIFNPNTWRMTEADIVYNPAIQFSTTGAANAQDVESVSVHEIGHFVGQTHSPLLQATMFPSGGAGATTGRSLSEDDRAGLRTLYPGATASSFATVTGLVRRSPTQVVSGAHVVLKDLPTGRSVTGGVTLPNGTFSIGSGPPGLYTVYAEPLDGPFAAGNLAGGIWNPAGYDTTFRTTFLGGNTNPTVIVARAGQIQSAGVITVSGPAPAMNITGAGLTSIPNGFSSFAGLPQTLTPPYTQWLAVGGPGFNLLPDSAFSLEAPFCSITGPSTLTGTLQPSGNGFKIFPIAVAANAPPGGYDIKVRDPGSGEIAFMAGALDVQAPASPQPWTAPYLSPCGGTAGPVLLSALSLPSVGNTAFSLLLGGTTGGQSGYFLLSSRPDALPVLPGCTAAVDVLALLIPFPGIVFPLSGGTTTIPTPIPNNPVLSGAEVFVQIVITAPGAPANIGISNGLMVHIQ
jgi:hypothetical protein